MCRFAILPIGNPAGARASTDKSGGGHRPPSEELRHVDIQGVRELHECAEGDVRLRREDARQVPASDLCGVSEEVQRVVALPSQGFQTAGEALSGLSVESPDLSRVDAVARHAAPTVRACLALMLCIWIFSSSRRGP